MEIDAGAALGGIGAHPHRRVRLGRRHGARCAVTVDQDRKGAQIGILVMAAIIGVLAIVGVRLINQLALADAVAAGWPDPAAAGAIALMSR